MKEMKIIISIDGPNLSVEVEGADGRECLDATNWMYELPSSKVVDQQLKVGVKGAEVPVGTAII